MTFHQNLIPAAYKVYHSQYPTAAPFYVFGSIPFDRMHYVSHDLHAEWVSSIQSLLWDLNPHTIFFETELEVLEKQEKWSQDPHPKSLAHLAFQVGFIRNARFASLEDTYRNKALYTSPPLKFLGISLANSAYHQFLFHHPVWTELCLATASLSLFTVFSAAAYAGLSRFVLNTRIAKMLSVSTAAGISALCIALNRIRDLQDYANFYPYLQQVHQLYHRSFAIPSLMTEVWKTYWENHSLSLSRAKKWADYFIKSFLTQPLSSLPYGVIPTCSQRELSQPLQLAASSFHPYPFLHNQPATTLDRAEAQSYAKRRTRGSGLGFSPIRSGKEPLARVAVVHALHLEALAQEFLTRGFTVDPVNPLKKDEPHRKC